MTIIKKFQVSLIFGILLFSLNIYGVLGCDLLGQVYNSNIDLVDGAIVEIKCVDGTFVGNSAPTSAGYYNWGNLAGDCNIICNAPNQINASTTFNGEYGERIYDSNGLFLIGADLDIYTTPLPSNRPPAIIITSIGGDSTPSINPNFSTNDTTPSVEVSTNVLATCRYSTGDQNYDDMTNECGDPLGITHTCDFGDRGEGTFDFYIACINGSGTKNSALDNGQANAEIDTTKPTKTDVVPSTGTYFTSTSAVAYVNISEPGVCRWFIGSDVGWSGMSGNPDCTASSDGLNHTCAITLPDVQGNHDVHIACADDTESGPNADDASESTGLVYILDSVPIIFSFINVSGDDTPSINPNFSVSDTTPNITISTSEDGAICYAINDNDLGFDDILGAGGVVCDADPDFRTHYCYFPIPFSETVADFYVACQDGAGNKNTAGNNGELDVKIDLTPPQPSNPNPVNKSTITSEGVNITLNLDDFGECRASLSDESFDDMIDDFDCTGDHTQAASCNITSGLVNSENNIFIACMDYLEPLSNKHSTGTAYGLVYSVGSETNAPNVIINTPSEGQIYSMSNILFNLSAVDNIAMSDCWYSFDLGAINNSMIFVDDYTDSKSLLDGNYPLNVWCNDSSNNINNSESLANFIIDTNSPYWVMINNQEATINEPFVGVVTAMDDGVGVETYWLNDTSVFSITSSGIINNLVALDTLAIYWLNVSVNDTLGNMNSYIISIEVVQDADPPVVKLLSPINFTSGTATSYDFKFNVSDVSDVENCSLIIDGVVEGILTTVNKSKENIISKSGISVGDRVWSVNCTDSYNNVGNSANWTLTVTLSGTPTSSGGGGGGGGNLIPAPKLNVTPTDIVVSGLIGSNKLNEILVENTGTTRARVRLRFEGLEEDTITVDESYLNFLLDSNSSKRIILGINIPQTPGVHTGKIFVNSEEILIRIDASETGDEDSLFDAKLLIKDEFKVVEFKDELQTEITLIPFGLIDGEHISVTLNYIIKDFDNNILFTLSESLDVFDEITFNKNFDLGRLPPGTYVIGLELEYSNGVAVASDNFVISPGRWALWVLILIRIFFLIWILLNEWGILPGNKGKKIPDIFRGILFPRTRALKKRVKSRLR
jgi:hypothetical protein